MVFEQRLEISERFFPGGLWEGWGMDGMGSGVGGRAFQAQEILSTRLWGRREPGVAGEQQGSRYGRNGASKGKQRVQALWPLCEVFSFCSEMGHQWRAVSRGLEE